MDPVQNPQSIPLADQEERAKPTTGSRRKKVFIKLVLIIFCILVVGYGLLLSVITPIMVGGMPIKPFIKGQTVLAENVSYLFKNPEVGDRVTFQTNNSGITFIGVVTKVEEHGDVGSYTIVSSTGRNPWVVSKDKIIKRVYYPFLSNGAVLKTVNAEIARLNPSPNPDPTANWKTYIDPNNLFSFKYPADLPAKITYNKDNSQVNLVSTPPLNSTFKDHNLLFSLFIKIYRDSSPETNDQIRQRLLALPTPIPYTYQERIFDIQDYQNNNINGIYYVTSVDQENATIQGHSNGISYNISFNEEGSAPSGETRELIDQILSTFKFTDQAMDISSWKTYTNAKYGYSIKYPPILNTKESLGTHYNRNVEIVSFGNYPPQEEFNKPDAISIAIETFAEEHNDIQDLKKWLEQASVGPRVDGTTGPRVYNISPYKISNIDALEYINGEESKHRNIVFYKNRHVFILSQYSTSETGGTYDENPEAVKVFEQMLSTLKFTP